MELSGRPSGNLKAWAVLLNRFAVRSNRPVYKAQGFNPGFNPGKEFPSGDAP